MPRDIAEAIPLGELSAALDAICFDLTTLFARDLDLTSLQSAPPRPTSTSARPAPPRPDAAMSAAISTHLDAIGLDDLQTSNRNETTNKW